MNISDLRLNNYAATYVLSSAKYNLHSLETSVLYEAKIDYVPEIFSYVVEIKGGKYMQNGKIEIVDKDRMKYLIGMNTHIKNSVLYFYKTVIK